jgi:hypothetical protein
LVLNPKTTQCRQCHELTAGKDTSHLLQQLSIDANVDRLLLLLLLDMDRARLQQSGEAATGWTHLLLQLLLLLLLLLLQGLLIGSLQLAVT